MRVDQVSLCLLGVLALNSSRCLSAAADEQAVPVTEASAFAPTIPNKTPPPGDAPKGMVWIPGGEFSMGCKMPSEGVCTMATMNAVNDAQPIHRVYVDGFWMDRTDVTNEEFARFVRPA
jgi:formylglycine-generating enzyme